MIKIRLLNLLILFGSLSCVILSGCGHSGKRGEGIDSLPSDLGVDTFTYSAVAGLQVTDSATIKENAIKDAYALPRLFSEFLADADTVEYNGEKWEHKHYYLGDGECKIICPEISSYENGNTAINYLSYDNSYILIYVKDNKMDIVNLSKKPNFSFLYPSVGIRQMTDSLKQGKTFKRARTNSRKVLSTPKEKWRLPMRIVYNENGVRLAEEGGPLVIDMPYNITAPTPEAIAILKKRMPSLLPPFIFPSLDYYFGSIYSED